MKKVNAFFYAKMIRMLMEGSVTKDEIAEQTGLHVYTVADYLSALHKEKAIHIDSWERRHNRLWAPAFTFGEKRDTPKPRPMTQRERQQAHRDRQKNGALLQSVQTIWMDAA